MTPEPSTISELLGELPPVNKAELKAWTPSPDMAETVAQERYAYNVEFFNPVPDGADYYPPED